MRMALPSARSKEQIGDSGQAEQRTRHEFSSLFGDPYTIQHHGLLHTLTVLH